MQSKILFENFSMYFPSEVDNVKSYRLDPVIPFELLLEFYDGSVHVFNDMDNSIYTIQGSPDGMTEREWRKEFGRRLRNKMVAKGIGQAELADLVGLSQSTISCYLNGRSIPDVYTADKIARVLDCSIDDLRYI